MTTSEQSLVSIIDTLANSLEQVLTVVARQEDLIAVLRARAQLPADEDQNVDELLLGGQELVHAARKAVTYAEESG